VSFVPATGSLKTYFISWTGDSVTV